MSGLILAGDVYLDILDASGARTGLSPTAINCTQFALNEASDLKQRVSRGKSTFGQALDAQGIKKPSVLDMTFDEASKDVFAMAILAASAPLTKSAGTVTSEALVAKQGKVIQLANYDVTNVVLKSTASTPVTFEAGTDYQVLSGDAGLVLILEDGAITDGESITAGYSYGAQAGTRLSGGAKPTVNAFVFLDGKNLVTGQGVIAQVDCAIITPSGALDLLNGDFVPYKLNSTLKTLPGKNAPYTVDLKGVA